MAHRHIAGDRTVRVADRRYGAWVSLRNMRCAMADTEQLTIVELDRNDASSGLALSTEAHWNQNEADWRFFLVKGIVFGARDNNDRLVATAALLPYSAGNAWISMVLVTQDQ